MQLYKEKFCLLNSTILPFIPTIIALKPAKHSHPDINCCFKSSALILSGAPSSSDMRILNYNGCTCFIIETISFGSIINIPLIFKSIVLVYHPYSK